MGTTKYACQVLFRPGEGILLNSVMMQMMWKIECFIYLCEVWLVPNATKMSSSEQTKQVFVFHCKKLSSFLKDCVDRIFESKTCGNLETILGKRCFLLVLS